MKRPNRDSRGGLSVGKKRSKFDQEDLRGQVATVKKWREELSGGVQQDPNLLSAKFHCALDYLDRLHKFVSVQARSRVPGISFREYVCLRLRRRVPQAGFLLGIHKSVADVYSELAGLINDVGFKYLRDDNGARIGIYVFGSIGEGLYADGASLCSLSEPDGFNVLTGWRYAVDRFLCQLESHYRITHTAKKVEEKHADLPSSGYVTAVHVLLQDDRYPRTDEDYFAKSCIKDKSGPQCERERTAIYAIRFARMCSEKKYGITDKGYIKASPQRRFTAVPWGQLTGGSRFVKGANDFSAAMKNFHVDWEASRCKKAEEGSEK